MARPSSEVYDPETSLAQMEHWYEHEGGREMIKKGVEEAQVDAKKFSESLKVDWRELEVPMDF